MQPLLTERQVAAILQISPKTLRNWRALEKGPAWRKYGRLVRYDCQDVQLWMAHAAVRQADEQFSRGLTNTRLDSILGEPPI
jgi:predicted DNA-binding transcriptional regulator AlpA